jgi:hypothetical protein
MNLQKSLISALIVVFLGLQGFVTLGPDQPHDGGYFWPFVSYPMYNGAHFEGEKLHQYRLMAILDGEEKEIGPYDFGMNYFTFQRGGIRAMLKADRQAMQKYADFYKLRTKKMVKAFRLEDRPLVLTKQGPKPSALEVKRMDL